MNADEFARRVQGLGGLTAAHIEKLTPLATKFGFTLVLASDRDKAIDDTFLATGRQGPAKVHMRLTANKVLGISRRYIEQRLAKRMELQVTSKDEKPVTQPTRSVGPMDVCSADIWFAAKPSQGYIGAVLMQDHWSNFVWSVPIKDKSSLTASKVFRGWFNQGFIPKTLRLDSGREWLGECLPVFLEFKVEVIFTTSNSRSQGGAERLNGVIKTLLARERVADGQPWPVALPRIVLAYNTTPVASRGGLCPHEIMFRRVSRLPSQLDMAKAPEPVTRGSNRDDWAEEAEEQFDPDHASQKEVDQAVQVAVQAAVTKAADTMVRRSQKDLKRLLISNRVRVRLAALDPKIRRMEKSKFAKASDGEFWSREMYLVTEELPGKVEGTFRYKVQGFRGSFDRADLKQAE
jgi:hypothetical protein